MTVLEREPSPEAQLPQFDVDYTARLLVYSFFFSQGDNSLQNSIIGYIARNNKARFDKSIIKAALNRATKMAFAIHNDKKTHITPRADFSDDELSPLAEDEAAEEVKGYVDLLGSLISEPTPALSPSFYPDPNISRLSKTIIGRDNRFLGLRTLFQGPYKINDTDGRRRAASKSTSPFTDSHLSHWVYFGIMAQATRMPEYDQMFDDMVANFGENRGYDDYYRESVNHLIRYQVKHHPDQLDLLPEWAREVATSQAT